MNMNKRVVNRRLAAVLLIFVVAVADVLLSFVSIGMGLEGGTVPDLTDGGGAENLLWARFAIAPLLAPLGAVALIWRHRFPRSVAAATSVLGALSLSGFAFIVALFLLARRRLDWWVAAVMALALAAEALLGTEAMDWQIALLGVAMLTAIAALGAYRGQRARHREAQLNALKERADQTEARHAADVEHSRLAERHRIAREMHDTLAHRMSLVAVQAAALQVDAPDEETAGSARLIRETAHAALGELRDVLGVLHQDGAASADAASAGSQWIPVANSRPGVAAAGTDGQVRAAPSGVAQIPGLLEEWRQAGVAVDYDPDPNLGENLPDAVSRAAFRVVQEGITNVARHAAGADAEVRLETHGAEHDGTGAGRKELRIVVSNGPGGTAEPAAGAGLGLVGLGERVQLLGGTLEHGPTWSGFQLEARIPFTEQPPSGTPEGTTE
ncbi:signal transduction histidine kinase [Arthrobacter stackebrandtii]|uniref:histidine kinase n=1 Tax=Arthrobacter stackebrandtii TaxID=272161 RepID=A0ABS4YZW4_9MICC|nr:histidine kinase [Arthrobacter stackebrandtii]MBP2413997.1 signal transduction histidine kinase [Arthrobacter stackebrandtii]PYG99010.1 hypothetical protein CVV67_17385 [Arthrobacter stackebrandtii]